MDSLMGKLSFAANGEPAKFSLEFGSGEFTPAEMKRIMADEKLAEMALADPKRVKRQVFLCHLAYTLAYNYKRIKHDALLQ